MTFFFQKVYWHWSFYWLKKIFFGARAESQFHNGQLIFSHREKSSKIFFLISANWLLISSSPARHFCWLHFVFSIFQIDFFMNHFFIFVCKKANISVYKRTDRPWICAEYRDYALRREYLGNIFFLKILWKVVHKYQKGSKLVQNLTP